MEENMVITLENDQKYLLLLENAFTDGKYFLSVLLDDKEQPTDVYVVLEERFHDGEEFTKVVTDPVLLDKLLDDYQEQYESME